MLCGFFWFFIKCLKIGYYKTKLNILFKTSIFTYKRITYKTND